MNSFKYIGQLLSPILCCYVAINVSAMSDTIFRQYDIRGRVGDELRVDEVYALTRSIASYFVKKNPQVTTVAVGMDGRIHSSEIKEEMCRALVDSGIDVVFIGLCSSPVLYFAMHTMPVDAGLMITASHNPSHDNGIKIMLGTKSVWGDEIQVVKHLYQNGEAIFSDQAGRYKEFDVISKYIQWTKNHFNHLVGCRLSMIFDCANGAAGVIMPQLIEAMEWDNAQLLYEKVDGTFPSHSPNPANEKNMYDLKKIMLSSKADIGIGFDGDADRAAALSRDGTLLAGDRLLALFAKPLLKKYSGSVVVSNVVSSGALHKLVEKWGGTSVLSGVGRSRVMQAMEETNALLGGETSCHFCFNDRHFGYDDGIYAALRIIEILNDKSDAVDDLLTEFPKKITSPEYRIACDEDKKTEIVAHVKEVLSQYKDLELITIDGVRAHTLHGWGIVRASNTQPVLSMRFESNTADGLKKIKRLFVDALLLHFSEKQLIFDLELV